MSNGYRFKFQNLKIFCHAARSATADGETHSPARWVAAEPHQHLHDRHQQPSHCQWPHQEPDLRQFNQKPRPQWQQGQVAGCLHHGPCLNQEQRTPGILFQRYVSPCLDQQAGNADEQEPEQLWQPRRTDRFQAKGIPRTCCNCRKFLKSLIISFSDVKSLVDSKSVSTAASRW